MGRPDRYRYRETDFRVNSKVLDGESEEPEMNDVTVPEVDGIVGRNRRF
jgi:hypothetical protein